MTSASSDSTKIDHFSSLPNEIIQWILDCAYPYGSYGRPYHAPSKRFHPFYQILLYRSIDIRSKKAVKGLVRTLQACPSLGLVTTSLEFCQNYEPQENDTASIADSHQLSSLLPLLPNLREWKLDACPSSAIINTITPAMLPSLTRICLPVTESEEAAISLDLLSWIANLPVLATLEACHWTKKEMGAFGHVFPTIRTLYLGGEKLTTRSVVKLVNACPNLTELRMFNASRTSVTKYERVLPHVEPRILRLSLGSFKYFPLNRNAFTNYSQLCYLRLYTESFPSDLSRVLSPLQVLEELILGSELAMVPYEELLKLVDGPRRLPKLRKVSLNIAEGCIGQRVNPFSPKGLQAIESREYEEWLVDIDEGKWFLDGVLDHGAAEWLECKRFLAVAKANGILVEGGLFDGLETLHAYLLELNNLSIVRAFYHSNFRTIPHARQVAADHQFPLPELDIDSIDPKNLELVKVEMEEYGWFALTLRGKELSNSDL